MCCARGTTSACAENTGAFGLPAGSAWNYLRVRGEYLVHRLWLVSESELPPRARRIPYLDISHLCDDGTTSACAENTLTWGCFATRIRNYLRVRGEYLNRNEKLLKHQELPPRARRILLVMGFMASVNGTTSACAENTAPEVTESMGRRELPPRARRIPITAHVSCFTIGTTSACAENTFI